MPPAIETLKESFIETKVPGVKAAAADKSNPVPIAISKPLPKSTIPIRNNLLIGF